VVSRESVWVERERERVCVCVFGTVEARFGLRRESVIVQESVIPPFGFVRENEKKSSALF
jgi:hypothetical protein